MNNGNDCKSWKHSTRNKELPVKNEVQTIECNLSVPQNQKQEAWQYQVYQPWNDKWLDTEGLAAIELRNNAVISDDIENLKNDSCGVRTHALADWRLKPAP